MKNINFIKDHYLETIKKNEELKIFKQCVQLNNFFNFESLLSVIYQDRLKNEIKFNSNYGINSTNIFSHVFQIYNVRDLPQLSIIHKQLCRLFDKHELDPHFRPDLFFNFKGCHGNVHADTEDVFIISLLEKTYYEVESEEIIELHPGDAIYIPKGCLHKASSLTKRIIVSWSIFS